ncbi:class I SAM-dependent methyltransferase [Aquipuribacter hungaricus]|uniref:class I SAM-dependent methyltransferase n=1 Tax=Aquipuribacter hungaricus TaxID=545624 RepID=UPI003621A92F
MPAAHRAPDAGARPDGWGALAPVYRWQEPLQRRSVTTLLRVLAPLPGERVLDVGAGTGLVCRSVPDEVRAVAAVEPSAGMPAAADLDALAAVRADAVRLPVADGSVDVVVASWLLHVLDAGDRAAAVAEAARVLRPGGRLGVVVPAVPRTTGQRQVRGAARRLADRRGLGAFRVPVDLPGLLTDAGLQVRHHARTGRGYLADVVVCTRAPGPRRPPAVAVSPVSPVGPAAPAPVGRA